MLSIHQQHPADFPPRPTCFPPNSTVVMASPISPAHSSYSVPSPFSSCSSASYPESTPSSERFVSSPDPVSHNVVDPSNFLLTAHPTPPTLASASSGTHSTASSAGSSVSTDYNYMMDWSKHDVTTAPKRPLLPHPQHPEHFQPNSVRYQSSRQQVPSQALPGDPQRLPDMSGIYMPPRRPSFRDEQSQQHPHHPSPVVIHSPVPIPVPSQIPQYQSPALTTHSPLIGGTNQHHVEQNPSAIGASLTQADPGIFGVETDEWGSSHQQASPGNLEFASSYPQTTSYSVTVAQRYPNPVQGRDLAPEFRADMSDALNHASRSYHSPVVDEGIQRGTYGTQPQTQVPNADVHSISQQRHVFDTSLPGQRLADAQSSPHELQSPISPSYYPQVHMSYQQQSPTYSVNQPPQNLDEHAKHISSNYTVSSSEPPIYREVSSEGSYYQPAVDTRAAMAPGYVGEPGSSFTGVCAADLMSSKDAMSAANQTGDDRLVRDEPWAQPLVNGRIYECETSRPDVYVPDGVVVGTRVDAVDGEADAEGDEDVDINYMARPVAAHIGQSDESRRGQALPERRFSDSVKLQSFTAHEDAGNEEPESDTEDDDHDPEYLPGRSCRQLYLSSTSTFYPYGESKSLRSRFNPYPNYSSSVSPTSPTDPNMPFELDQQQQQQQHSFAGSSQATTAQDQAVAAQPRLRNRRSYSFPSVLPMGRSIDASGSSMSSAASTTTVRRRTRPGAALPIPVPVPNLTKKSRGRRVPTVDEFQAEIAAAAAAAGIPPGESHLGVGRKRNTISGAIGGTGASKGTRTYTCEVDGCGKLFARGEHLKRHVRSIHTYEKPHRCPYPGCGKDFSRHDNLGQHMRVHKDYVPPKNIS